MILISRKTSGHLKMYLNCFLLLSHTCIFPNWVKLHTKCQLSKVCFGKQVTSQTNHFHSLYHSGKVSSTSFWDLEKDKKKYLDFSKLVNLQTFTKLERWKVSPKTHHRLLTHAKKSVTLAYCVCKLSKCTQFHLLFILTRILRLIYKFLIKW